MKKNRVIVNCGWCEAKLERTPSNLKICKKQFCNIKDKDCLTQWQKKNSKGKLNYFWKNGKIKTKCSHCNKEIYKKNYTINKNKNNFCSITCKAKWQIQHLQGKSNPCWRGGKQKVKCEWCNKELIIKLYKFKKYKIHFCSYECSSAWKKKYWKGSDSPGWKGGLSKNLYGDEFIESLKKEIRKRDNNKCRLCNAPQQELIIKLHIHHIDYNKQNSQKNNLVSLCRDCHMKTNNNREYWKLIFQNMIQNKGVQDGIRKV